jgi:hypothetical protein
MLNQYASIFICLFSEHLVAALNRSEGLLTGLRVGSTEDQLGIQLPRSGDVPGLGDLLIDEGAVVLKVGTEALRLKGSPDLNDS